MRRSIEKNPIKDTYQMNDYTITKWTGDLMCMNSATMFCTKTLRVHPMAVTVITNTTALTKVLPKYLYTKHFRTTLNSFEWDKRIINYVEDTARTFANI